ncbi:tyrosine recombinase XerC [Clostridium tepidiprofundi DSM 19306]|uniref:Tyrosine recombinase XerC n=1 Tax=Clostridium tepidiprofundi DSM 19306 TaxID=1121338 RepID=A0A151B624_9CLOT|nr:site-specific integrase [Clostridium tepidiprofundi]KYH35381.1 tyrosine recombinase XerC [Clostridium tepidiprofundi DSM 19306]
MPGVYKRGDKWYYYFNIGKVNGSYKKICRKGGMTKIEAEKALRKALEEYESTGDVKAISNISVSDYFDYWFENYVLINCKYNTQQLYETVINNHIKPALGTHKLKALTPAMLQEFINKKYKNGFSRASIGNFYGVLSGALKAAVYPYQYIKENPMQYVKLPKENKMKENANHLKIISIQDFNKIINRFPQGSSFYIPLQIAFHTGLRAAEVCGLTWDCIDLENKFLKVEKILIGKGRGIFEFGTPKTKSSNRSITIGSTLVTILKKNKIWQNENKLKYGQYYKNSNFVCTKENGENITPNTLKYLSRVVNYELGIKFNFHSLRHTHATMLLEAGANIKDIQKRLGHSKIATTMDTYSHVTEKMKNDTVEIFESLVAKK